MERFTISLNDLKFHSRIGVLELERTVGSEFVVDVDFDIEVAGFRPEVLESTVSYADVYEIISESMQREWKLIESVAREIARKIGEQWPQIISINVKIAKMSPPIPGISGFASVKYSKQ